MVVRVYVVHKVIWMAMMLYICHAKKIFIKASLHGMTPLIYSK